MRSSQAPAVRIDADLFARLKRAQYDMWEKTRKHATLSDLIRQAFEAQSDGAPIAEADRELLADVQAIKETVGEVPLRAALRALRDLALAKPQSRRPGPRPKKTN